MRSPASRSREVHASPREDVAVAATNQQQEAIEETNAEDLNHKAGGETQTQQELERPPSRPLTGKRTWRTASQLANRGRRSSLQLPRQQQLDSEDGASTSGRSPMRQSSVDDFAVEIESEAAEIRTLIARTAQLWSAVDRAERAEDLPPVPQPLQLQASRRVSTSAIQTREAGPYGCEEERQDDSTLSSEEEEFAQEDDTETDMALQSVAHVGGYSSDDEAFEASLRFSGGRTSRQRALTSDETNSDGGDDNDQSSTEDDTMEHEIGDLQIEQGEIMDGSNRAINASKARAIKNAMLGNLIRLGFRENIARAALEAGVLEIDHYDSDCELAYVDIFMSLVKMVCDAHVDVVNGNDDVEQMWDSPDRSLNDHDEAGAIDPDSLEQRSFLPFKWPVFDMAQFEFGNARSGTCFNSVCVLTNLPKVSMDRTEELMEILSCNLFCMIGDPIQVVIPSASSTGRTKGHAFLEFDDSDMAKRCASAVDGLTWGRGPFGRIRGNLFRQYQVKTPAEEQQRSNATINNGTSIPRSYSGMSVLGSFPENVTASAFECQDNARQQELFCDSDEDSSDAGEWVGNRPLYAQFNPSPLLDLSSGSVDINEQYEPDQTEGISMHFGWDDEALRGGYAVQLSTDEGDDHESFDSNSVLELQTPYEEKGMDRSLFDELVGGCRYNEAGCSPARVSLSSGEAQAGSSTVTSTASCYAREALADCGMEEQQHFDGSHGDDSGVEKPWRKYCEDLIVRNREMQEQVAFARRRIVQLSHNNQKLHLLIDRVERDRDGLLFENDLLQTQLHGYEDHEQHHDSLMKELVMLRKRLKQKEHSFDLKSANLHQHFQPHFASTATTSNTSSSSFNDIRSALSQFSGSSLACCKINELKEWEQLLENTLSHVRSAKEEKALEMQKKLDRQVEEQNELKLCVICLSNEKSILCLPCRHLCLCKTCSSREEVTKCPICRLEIDEMLAVYS